MSKVRLVLAAVTLVILTGGFVASQIVYKYGEPSTYSRALDASPVVFLSLGLLVAAIIFAFVPTGESETNK